MRLEIYRMYKSIRDYGVCVDPRRFLPAVSVAASSASEEPEAANLNKQINSLIREIHDDEAQLREGLEEANEIHNRIPEGGVGNVGSAAEPPPKRQKC